MNTAIYSVAAFTAYDIVNQIMVSDTGTPLIQAITALEDVYKRQSIHRQLFTVDLLPI